MNDYDTEQAKAARRERILKIKPKAAPAMLTESEFNREFVEYRFVSLEHLSELEETNHVMFCPACSKGVNNVMGKRRVLHIRYEADALGNYPFIAVTRCYGCSWEEMIPVIKHELTNDERDLLRRFKLVKARGDVSTSPPLAPQIWGDATKESLLRGDMRSLIGSQPSAIRFEQTQATRFWGSIAQSEQDRREVELAKKQIDMIERLEAEQRATTHSQSATKAAMLSQMYGAGPTRMADIARRYQQMAGQQMQNLSFTHDETTALKKEPADAAKAAHQVLLDKVKQAFKK